MKRLVLGHIVCPIDFSGQFRASLAHAMAIAGARDAEVRAVHVVPSDGAAVPEGLGALERHDLMQRLRDALGEADPGHTRIGAGVRTGDPGTQILQFARALPADLIVMGAPGVDRPERPLGPVASVVIARSDCPVMAVPAHSAAGREVAGVFSRIVCAVDSAPSSAGVMRQALSLAWEAGGHLTYVCVVPEAGSATLAQIRVDLLSAVPPEASEWCEMDILVTTGAPAREVTKFAGENRADLVVVGAPRRWTSTTHAVLSQSLCPVLVTHDVRPLPWPAVPNASSVSG
jgi:nucleotide-binding universal stress UspA family protein